MNCKPGDLAYLSSDCVAEGVVVEVLTSAHTADGAPAWHCRSRTPIDCITERTQRAVSVTEFVVEDRYLRPIAGAPVHDEQLDEVTA